MNTVSTVVRFPRGVLADLKIRAAKEGSSMAALIRRAVEQTYGTKRKERRVAPKDSSFYALVGSVAGQVNDSRDHDKVIYGIEDPVRHKRVRRLDQRQRR